MLARLVWALGLVCAISVAARAQDKPDFAAAKKHYLAAKQAQQKGDTDGAVRSYILAYDITKDPSLFKQIAVAYEAGGKKSEAAVYYRRYLAEAKPGPDVDEVRAKLATMQGGAAKDTASAATKKSPLPPEPPKLPPEPSPAEQKALEPLPPVPTAPALFEDRGGAGWQRTAAWVSVGLAAVALTTGTVLATSSLSREEDVRRLLEFREPGSNQPSRYQGSVRDDYLTKDDEGKKLSRYATYSFIGAGALAGGAVLFFILDATRGVEKRTAFVPVIGRDQLGVSAGWEF